MGLVDDTIRAVLGMIKSTGVDKLCGSCDWIKMMGMTSPKVDKFCGYCDLMKKMGLLDSPTAKSGDKSSYTKVGYDGIYAGGEPDSIYPGGRPIMPDTEVGYGVEPSQPSWLAKG